MQTWEYRLVSIEVDWDEESNQPYGIDKNRLSQLGNEGWELVGIAPVNGPLEDGTSCTVEIQYVFKRPKAATPKANGDTPKADKKKSAPPSSEDASRIQSSGARHPESKTAKSGFALRAQSAATKKASSNGKH